MSDVVPNYELERERIKLEIAQLELNQKSQKFRIMTIEDEKNRIADNIKATQESIQELKNQLEGITNE